ncbi:tetratricopeptide repeat protein [Starkeya sp. ORNL1]|nr:tetratricopeptide repeat protein [Starkeya sp. ORNL1]
MPTGKELDDTVYEQIKAFCANGDALAKAGAFKNAVGAYGKAWELVPIPKNEWNASTWILAAIADACFLGGNMKSAYDTLAYAMTCPGAIGNPFLHLRFGQVLHGRGELDRAADELIRAYALEGAEIFANEHPRYLAFLKTRAIL